jgi:hypothetical protein
MDGIADEDFVKVASAARDVVTAARELGVWVFSGGVTDQEEVSLVGTDLAITARGYDEAKNYVGGFTILELSSREEALEWAGRIAQACRCAQEVREMLPDSLVSQWLAAR